MRRRPRQSAIGVSTSFFVGIVVVALFAVMTLTTRTQGIPSFTPPEIIFPEVSLPEQPAPTPTSALPSTPPTPDTPMLSAIVNIIGILLVIALAGAVVFFIVKTVRSLWRERRLQLRAGSAVSSDVAGESATQEAIDAPIVRKGISGALATIDDTPEPGEAIIAAWIGLEETAQQAGIMRGDAETPAEFVLRLIVRTDAISEPADILLGIYEQVRFGGAVATEHERSIARGALQRIEEGWR